MTKTLQLAKHFDAAKLGDRLYRSVKYDGVPVRFDVSIEGGVPLVSNGLSRQGETLVSTEFIRIALAKALTRCALDTPVSDRKMVLIGEVMHEDYTGFKDISGVVRRQSPQSGLYLLLFDFWDSIRSDDPFMSRLFAMQMLLSSKQSHKVRLVHQDTVFKRDIADITSTVPDGQEGWIIRDAMEKFQPGKRTWGYQKVVKEPTIDLRIVGFEEGIGKNANAVGRLIAEYNGTKIGVGPGKMTYAERQALWERDCIARNSGGGLPLDLPRMACIKYKPDEGYAALRQPTFQHWRDDKDAADA